MLKEWLRSLRTPASSTAREMGYLYESIALEERARRCQKSWENHVLHCHSVVREAIRRTKQRRQVVVLGSGPLIEIPMTELLHHFQQVVLVDIVQPIAVRKAFGDNGRVLLIEKDMTGIAEDLQDLGARDALPVPRFPDFGYLSPDLTISANLLSQLPLLPCGYLEEKFGTRYSDVELNTFARAICTSHLEGLKALPGAKLVWTDLETNVLRDDGVLMHTQGAPVEWADWKMLERWTWSLAPLGEIDRRQRVEMSIGSTFFEAPKDRTEKTGKV